MVLAMLLVLFLLVTHHRVLGILGTRFVIVSEGLKWQFWDSFG